MNQFKIQNSIQPPTFTQRPAGSSYAGGFTPTKGVSVAGRSKVLLAQPSRRVPSFFL
ncbi:hypothetical protein H6G36_26715 [Anabaena minutissima FACHB-250]|nr:hypothetical protein [Anabaena minutissima FACHB-250]